MTNSSYGWLAIHSYASQSCGFFVDEKNRILFWPKKRQAGYVVEFDVAERILQLRAKHFFNLKIFGIGAGLSLFCLICLITWRSYFIEYAAGIFGIEVLIIPILGPIFVFCGGYWWFVGRQHYARDLAELLTSASKIDRKRPSAQRLKPSELHNRSLLWGWIVFGILEVLALLMLFAILTSNNFVVGPAVFFAITSIAIPSMLIWSLWLERTGIRLKDVRFYDRTSNASAKP